jgi:hypothetical protein
MKDYWFGIMLTVFTIGCLFVFFGPFLFGQLPPMAFPDHDVAYSCVSTIGDGAPITFKFTAVPTPHFEVITGNRPVSNDTMNPIIVSVTSSAGVDLTTGAVKLLAANNGLSLTVGASDNVGIVSGKLEVDGVIATPFGNGLEVLPNPFYVRWNSRSIAVGNHGLRLTVCDAALNCSQRTWSMTR